MSLAGRHPLGTLFLIVAMTVGCDRAAKHLAESHLKGAPPQSFLGGTLRLQYIENTGAFLSLGAGWASSTRFWLLTVPAALALFLIAIHILRRAPPDLQSLVAYSLILAGGLANLWDRVLRQGRVVDFLNLGVGWLRTGIFNVADLALTVGIALLVARQSRRRRPRST